METGIFVFTTLISVNEYAPAKTSQYMALTNMSRV
jgi:hypothetical protein